MTGVRGIVPKGTTIGRFTIDGPIGRGATASVYRCLQEVAGKQIPRALKLMDPTDDVIAKRAAAGQTSGASAFQQEIENLTALNHQNLVRIIDAGTHESFPFFVMDLVSGFPLQALVDEPASAWARSWRDEAQDDPFIVPRIIRQVLWALVYLHERDFFHMDVATKNVFLSRVAGKPHIVLGDIGVGQFLRPDDPEPSRQVLVAGTRKYAPAVVHALLNIGSLPAQELRGIAPKWDTYSTAIVLQELLLDFGLNSNPQLKPICLLAEQVVRSFGDISAAEFVDELGRLMPDHVRTVGLDELSPSSIGAITSIRIPLVDVPISSRIGKIIAHPMFSRLRLVPQLLLVRTMYPGGVHSRFEHAIGSYELARRVLLTLIAQADFRLLFRKKELEEALLTALLAHLDAYPLHHVIEETYPDVHKGVSVDGKVVSTLEWFLDYVQPDVPSLRSVISAEFPTADLRTVLEILSKDDDRTMTNYGYRRAIKALVRSSIDVRVMDYLVRDAHHTGANTGTNIDIDHIIRSIQFNAATGGLSITRAGVHAVENLLSARYWMFTRVYWGPPNRSLFAMLRYVVTTLVENGTITVKELIENSLFCDEFAFIRQLEQLWSRLDDSLQNASILPFLLAPRPRFFSTLLEFAEHSDGTPSGLISRFRGYRTERLEAIRKGMIHNTRSLLSCEVRDSDLLLDIPRETGPKLGEDIDLFIDDMNYKSLIGSSKIVEALPKAYDASAIKLRVFISPTLRGRIKESSFSENQLREELTKFLVGA